MVPYEDEDEGEDEGEEVQILPGRSTRPLEGHHIGFLGGLLDDLLDDHMVNYLVGHPEDRLAGRLVGLLRPECAVSLTVKEHRTCSRWPL